MEVRGGFLLIHSVPYVNARREVSLGTLVTDLRLNDDKTQKPDDHQVWFAGDHPCYSNGSQLGAIFHTSNNQTLGSGITVNHRFSCKPSDGYPDYHAKMTRYIEIISNQARAIDANATARTFKPIESDESDSVFNYIDSASCRAGISQLSGKLAMSKIGIVGLGGTGSYILDHVAKTHVCEIHLFDGDEFQQHNAFRTPGAASLQVLKEKLSKVEYFTRTYANMRRGIIAHDSYIDEENVGYLREFDFIFLCVDKPSSRALVARFLQGEGVPFIDVGMELGLLEDQQCLIGTCRVTLSSSERSEHFECHVSLKDAAEDDIYGSNIQVSDLNALNAALAVIKWKKYCGYYRDAYREHQSAYVIDTHQLTRDESIQAAGE